MHKSLLILPILLGSLYSKDFQKEKLQILSNDLNSKDNIVIAKGDVVIFSPKYYISAQKVIYDKENGTLELFDNVVILKDNIIQTQSDYAFVDLNNESVTENPILLLDNKSQLWVTSHDANKEKDSYHFKDSIMSSCDCIDPAWNIRFSSADYDTKDQWLNAYNARLYIKNIPVMYTPYIGFSTDKTRRTGLLRPTVGYSSGEGFLYSQPIFIAPADNYDVELIPQVRLNRGYGMYAYYRYADSPDSILKIGSGYFKEKDDYVKENSLRNDNHFGWNIDYLRNNIFSGNDSDDGLYASIKWLNDIEYYNLEDSSQKNSSVEKKVESKVNYYYKNNDYYFGTYLRHYMDTNLDSNKTTLQQLPQVQLHSFSDNLFFDKLLYSADLQSTNYTRQTGIDAVKTDLNVPVSYSFSMFDDYLRVILQEEVTVSKINYSNANGNYKNATFVENRHKVTLNTNLVKKYDTGIHTINFNTDFVIPNVVKSEGDIYPLTNTSSELSPFPLSKTTKTITFSLNQSWTDLEDLKEIINHKISQSIIYDDFNNTELGDLENEIRYNYFLGSISNRIVYSNLDNKLTESSTSFSFNYENYFFNATHYMSKNTPNSGKEDLESYTLNTGFTFYKDYKFTYEENYNIEKKLRNKQAFILGINDKCWDLNLSYTKEITPSSSTIRNSRRQDIVFLELTLKPIGGFKQQYTVKEDK
ncbi:Organic solvent tolerance protein [Arcobacter nitrofigilis DSM 7299]|uniref:Organic solvent tolerance protein n=1 Tax=Arcobacter nitrofigilis (strain ATCC 33309 / DSM 7299 / CCUG 15893 / LMG 7604 / NCTC 12251 / CI) TaxID=572480 RepID=D5V1J4_ARCNC|nr:LPS assembly protein LptD [Arcobacter nitrofigilis]ADG93428.1 Organic solvent tolerance protein [Arcobacter nitrofigilis DSM 7299]